MPPITREAVAPTGHRSCSPSNRRHSDPDPGEGTDAHARRQGAPAPISSTIRLSTGRTVAFEDCTGSTSIWDMIEGGRLTFADPEELAQWVGIFYGWRSTTPTHGFSGWDGVAYWVVDTMTLLYTRWPASYFDLVPGLEMMTPGQHARLVLLALEAAGLVIEPIEATAAA